jgi:hypothetical protein
MTTALGCAELTTISDEKKKNKTRQDKNRGLSADNAENLWSHDGEPLPSISYVMITGGKLYFLTVNDSLSLH